MPRQRHPDTIHERTLAFLRDAHRAIQTDANAPLTYLALHHRLSSNIVQAIQVAGLVKRGGWSWYWIAAQPNKAMAKAIREAQLQMQRQWNRNYQYARR